MTSFFQKRGSADYGTSSVSYNAMDWDTETKYLYLIGRKPNIYFDKFKNEPEWLNFLSKNNIEIPSDQNSAANIASIELASRIVTKEALEKLADNIIEQVKNNADKNIDKVRVSVPFPIDETATPNKFAPALAAAFSAGLQSVLPEKLSQAGLGNLEVIADLDSRKSDPERAILNIVNNLRGSTSNPEPGKEVDLYMQRLTRQPVYSGNVDKNAIYVPVDDFLVSQTTMVGMINYIQTNGGITSMPVNGVKLFQGVEVLAPQQATLDYLNITIKDLGAGTLMASGGVDGFKRGLQQSLSQIGLNLDFNDVSKTNLSNVELMFLAGYFANNQNPAHKDALENALKSIGSSLEQAKGNSPYAVFDSPPHNLQDFRNIINETLNAREMMTGMESNRFRNLVSDNLLVEYRGK